MAEFEDILRVGALDVQGRRVWLRADLDAQRSTWGVPIDDAPLREILPSVRAITQQRGKVILAASFENDDPNVPNAVKGVAARLSELLGSEVGVLGTRFVSEFGYLTDGQVAIMPNLAALPEELAGNDAEWARDIARGIDVYLLDGVRAARGAETTLVKLPSLLCSRGVGPLAATALDIHYDVIEAAASPFALVLGGSRLGPLLPLVKRLLPSCQDILLGGAVANTFLVAAGWTPGASPHEPRMVADAAALLQAAQAANVRVHWPTEVVMFDTTTGAYSIRPLAHAAPHEAVVDLATQTCSTYRGVLAQAATALWLGPAGDCKVPETQGGSLQLGQAVAEAARAIAVGAETAAAARLLGIDGLLRIGAGGDALFALLAGESFPGLESLRG